MRLIYNERDITDSVRIRQALVRDAAGQRCDSIDITLAEAGKWYRWQPAENDRIELTDDGYRSGICYVNTITPEGDDYRILATACRTDCGQKKNETFISMELGALMEMSAAACKMGSSLYGIDGKILYPYLQQDRESLPGMMDRLAEMEGACLKTYNGKFILIGIEAASELPAMEDIEITPETKRVTYIRQDAARWRSCTVLYAGGAATARDGNAEWGTDKIFAELPASDSGTAARWARGLLLSHNRRTERLSICTSLHTAWSAMVRIDVHGGTDADGSWIIDECSHDLVRRESRAELLRVYRVEKDT